MTANRSIYSKEEIHDMSNEDLRTAITELRSRKHEVDKYLFKNKPFAIGQGYEQNFNERISLCRTLNMLRAEQQTRHSTKFLNFK